MSVKRSVKYNYESLANAIVKQAYDDYCESMQPIAPGIGDSQRRWKRNQMRWLRDDCESFFRGGWYDTLTALPPEILTRAALTEKRKGIVYDWLKVLNRERFRIWKKTRRIDWQFRTKKNKTRMKISDSRHKEYLEKKAWRKRRLSNGKNERHYDNLHIRKA